MNAETRRVAHAHTPPATLRLHLPDEAATQALGQALGPLLMPGMVVWLEGDLGAGKTALTRAVLRGLGYAGPVKSPTYTLVEFYVVSRLYLYHFDFYRFNEPVEFEDAGLGEYFREDTVCLVEWPDKAAGYVPAADLRIEFRFAWENEPKNGAASGLENGLASGRRLILYGQSAAGRQCLNGLHAGYSSAAS